MRSKILALLAVGLLAASSANATEVAWTLTGVTLSDGTSVSGSFVYDADSNAYSAWSVSVQAGSLSAFSYITALSLAHPNNSDATGLLLMENGATRYINLNFLAPLTDAGGTIALDTNPPSAGWDAGSWEYGSVGGSGVVRWVTAGSAIAIATPVEITIDIRPAGIRNTINPRHMGFLWVAILSDTKEPFDPLQIEISSVRFGPDGARALRHWVRDVNSDGLADLLLMFWVPATGIDCGDTEAILTAKTYSGETVQGTDEVRTVGCKPSKHCGKDRDKRTLDCSS